MNTSKILTYKLFFFRVAKPIIIILFVILVGIVGYSIIEGWNTLDSLYMSIISLTTVGYETPRSLSFGGKLFTCIYLMFSVVIFLYLASEFANHVISFNLEEVLSKKKMDSRIKNLKNHYIVCGFGRTGRAIASQLVHEKQQFLVIDVDQQKVIDARNKDYLAIVGDCTDDNILKESQVNNAKGLFAVLNQDADNLFITITAKDLNPNIRMVVRCSKTINEAKFYKVGVDKVISPFRISALRMVSSVLRPVVAEFLEEVTTTEVGLELRLEQVLVPESSKLCDKKILDSEIRPKTGAIVLAIKKDKGLMHNPDPSTIINAGDYLIILGSTDQLLKFEDFINQ